MQASKLTKQHLIESRTQPIDVNDSLDDCLDSCDSTEEPARCGTACAVGQSEILARLNELASQVQALQDRETAPSLNPPASKTLLVGASVLREIDSAGLLDTDVHCLRGFTLEKLQKHLLRTELSVYHTIVVQCSTNNTGPDQDYKAALDNLLDSLLDRAPHVQIVLSGLCPRADKQEGKVAGYNRVVCAVAVERGLQHVTNEASFKYQDGRLDYGLLHRDQLHPSKRGTALLLKNIDSVVPILRPSSRSHTAATNAGTKRKTKQTHTQQDNPRRAARSSKTQPGSFASALTNSPDRGTPAQSRTSRQQQQQQGKPDQR